MIIALLSKIKHILKNISQLFINHSLQSGAHKTETFSHLSRQLTCLVWPSRLRDLILSCRHLHILKSSRLSWSCHFSDRLCCTSNIGSRMWRTPSGHLLPLRGAARIRASCSERRLGLHFPTLAYTHTHTLTHLEINCCTHACGNKQSHAACGNTAAQDPTHLP